MTRHVKHNLSNVQHWSTHPTHKARRLNGPKNAFQVHKPVRATCQKDTHDRMPTTMQLPHCWWTVRGVRFQCSMLHEPKRKCFRHEPFSLDYIWRYQYAFGGDINQFLLTWITSFRCSCTATQDPCRATHRSMLATTAAIDGLDTLPAPGWFTSAPNTIVGAWCDWAPQVASLIVIANDNDKWFIYDPHNFARGNRTTS